MDLEQMSAIIDTAMQTLDRSEAEILRLRDVETRQFARIVIMEKTLRAARAALLDTEEYCDGRADADQPAGVASPIPNEEMRLLVSAREALVQVDAALGIGIRTCPECGATAASSALRCPHFPDLDHCALASTEPADG